MERKFECDDGAFLRVSVCAVYNEEGVYDYDVSYVDHDTGESKIIPVIEEQLTTAGETADDLANKLHEAEAEIERLRKALETTRLLSFEQDKTIADYRYLFDHKPEWREYILHEMCESWRGAYANCR